MSDERRIEEVLARYVRATDRRDGKAQGDLFTDDAIVQIHERTGPGTYAKAGEPLRGGADVEYAVTHYMAPHPEGGSSHHLTGDHIIDVDGDVAHLDAQFVVFETRAARRPAEGWPAGAAGVQGSVRATESGYYRTTLRRIEGRWMIIEHHVLNDLPFALPAAR